MCPLFNFTRVLALYVKTITMDNLVLGPSAHGLDLGLKRSRYWGGLILVTVLESLVLVWVLGSLVLI